MEAKGARAIRKDQTDRLLAAFKKLRHDGDRQALVEQAENWAIDQKVYTGYANAQLITAAPEK
jgi:hypothetical protein